MRGPAGRHGATWVGMQSWVVTCCVAAAGLMLVIGPSITDGRIPGDLGDARFNSYILEHFFRWLTGRDANFWSADFFYPFPLTIAFSDNLLGNAPIYALFRALGYGREDAFRFWYVGGFILNFAAGHYALTRLGYSHVAASLGAFLFTFGLPVSAQEGHAQLVYRFGVPLAILALENFRASRQVYQLAAIAFWTTWQFYCSIYIGYFLLLLLAAIIVSHVICRRNGPLRAIRSSMVAASSTWSGASSRAKLVLLLTIVFMSGLMAALIKPYLEASHLYGFHRQWSEIAYMLPRPKSYLLASTSRLWPSKGPWFDTLPMRHEHTMFIGVAPVLAVVVAAALRLARRAKLDALFAPVSVAILLVVLLTLHVGHSSAYYVLMWLPGVDAIRGVTRIITVLLFPCGMLLASSTDSIAAASIPTWARSLIVAFIGILIVLESSYIQHLSQTKQDWQVRMPPLTAELPKDLPNAPILLLAPRQDDPAPWARELDAMLFAQDRGWRTLNGYSGNSPPRPDMTGTCRDAAVGLVSGLNFLGRPVEQNYDALLGDVVMAGYPPCTDPTLLQPPQLTMFAGRWPTQSMARVAVQIESLTVHERQVVVSAKIVNDAASTLPAYSTTAMPIRLSMRYVAANTRGADLRQAPGWNLRQAIGFDVPAGAACPIMILMAPPAQPGSYRLALSIVQEGVTWFHDQGMQIPISRQTIDVAEDHTVHVSNQPHE